MKSRKGGIREATSNADKMKEKLKDVIRQEDRKWGKKWKLKKRQRDEEEERGDTNRCTAAAPDSSKHTHMRTLRHTEHSV